MLIRISGRVIMDTSLWAQAFRMEWYNWDCTDLGDILIMPLNEIRTPRGNQDDIHDGYASRYSHDNEIARPEYYSLLLDRYQIKAELTATDRAG